MATAKFNREEQDVLDALLRARVRRIRALGRHELEEADVMSAVRAYALAYEDFDCARQCRKARQKLNRK